MHQSVVQPCIFAAVWACMFELRRTRPATARKKTPADKTFIEQMKPVMFRNTLSGLHQFVLISLLSRLTKRMCDVLIGEGTYPVWSITLTEASAVDRLWLKRCFVSLWHIFCVLLDSYARCLYCQYNTLTQVNEGSTLEEFLQQLWHFLEKMYQKDYVLTVKPTY